MSGTRIGVRALTMQQPFAAAMVANVGLFSRRGRPTKFPSEGEWVAVHCGINDEHVKNSKLMAAVRAAWPDCPSDTELRKHQGAILGLVHFVDGNVNANVAAKECPMLQLYDCQKPVCWRADCAVKATKQEGSGMFGWSYPRGALQVWVPT